MGLAAPDQQQITSEAARILGRKKSKAKAAASRINGCKGGRPAFTERQRSAFKQRAKTGSVPGNSHQRRKARRSAQCPQGCTCPISQKHCTC